MCGRYFRRSDKQEIAKRFRLEQLGDFPLAPDYNIAPSTFQPIVRLHRDSGDRELALLRWGLVPFFAKSLDAFKGFSTINARAETVASAATWRGPLERRRCLVPADGFYEWKTVNNCGVAIDADPRPMDTAVDQERVSARIGISGVTLHDPMNASTTETNSKPPNARFTHRPAKKAKVTKTPFAFSLTDDQPLAFAGLWDAWKSPAGDWLQSFAIITTDANALMEPVHNRMPVILHPRDWAEWLDRDAGRPAPVHLLRPYEPEAMRADACNPLVGNVRNNGPEMLLPPLNSV